MNYSESLIARWSSANIRMRPGLSEEELESFTRAFKVIIPPEMADFYRRLDGFEVGVMDPITRIRIWSFAEISPSSEDRQCVAQPCTVLFEFADYLIDSHRYAIALDTGGTAGEIFVVGNRPKLIARSYREFLSLLEAVSSRLLVVDDSAEE